MADRKQYVVTEVTGQLWLQVMGPLVPGKAHELPSQWTPESRDATVFTSRLYAETVAQCSPLPYRRQWRVLNLQPRPIRRRPILMQNPIPPEPMSGYDLRRLRERVGMERAQFAALLHLSKERLKNLELEKNNARVDAPLALLVRLTCDPLLRAQWLRGIQEPPEGEP